MKRIFSIILLLLILFGAVACSSKGRSSETSSTSKPENRETLSEQKSSTSTESENQETLSDKNESTSAEDFQAGIPEEYRLKINISPEWNEEPLPTSEYSINSPLFGIGDYIDPQQAGAREPVILPKMEELFTIEELEAYFGMNIKIDEDINPSEGSDGVRYRMYKAEKKGFWDGEVNIWINDWGDPVSASSTMNILASDPREIEGLGNRALISKGRVYILMKDGLVLSVSVEYSSPESGGWMEPAEEELVLDFARLAYDRAIEKLE